MTTQGSKYKMVEVEMGEESRGNIPTIDNFAPHFCAVFLLAFLDIYPGFADGSAWLRLCSERAQLERGSKKILARLSSNIKPKDVWVEEIHTLYNTVGHIERLDLNPLA